MSRIARAAIGGGGACGGHGAHPMADAFRQISQRLRDDRRARIAVAIAIAVNLLLLSAYVWSRGGQTTHVRVEARGDQFTIFVDGRQQAQAQLVAAPQSGGFALTLDDTHDVPSLPSPRGIDSVTVRALDTGELLFHDGFFSSPDDATWTKRDGAFTDDGGVLGVRGAGQLTLSGRDWRDFSVDVVYRNVSSGSVIMRAQPDGTGAVATVRPFRWNRDTSETISLATNSRAVTTSGAVVEAKRAETMRALVAMTLRPYPWLLLALALAALAVWLLQLAPLPRFDSLVESARTIPLWMSAGIVIEFAFAIAVYISYSLLSHQPHVPDGIAYVFQAKVLASGHLSASPPPVPAAFEFISPPFVQIFGSHWAAVYPFGHPLLLAIGARAGVVWLIPPLVGAACVAMILLLGRKLFDARTGAVAMILLATSPFFLMQAGSFMSHNTAAFYLLASMLALAYIDRRPALYGVIAGVAFGLLLNTRPLTALALVVPFGAWLLSMLIARTHRRTGAIEIAAFVAVGLLMIGAYLLYNYGTTGHVFSSGYQSSGDPTQQVGFSGAHSVAAGMQNEQIQMAFLLLVLNGWPTYVGLALVLLPFLLGTRDPRDWFLLASAIFVVGAWTLFEGNGVMYGPRYWYEAVPFLMLLSARGAERAAAAIAGVVTYVRAQRFAEDGATAATAQVVVYTIVAALVGSSIYGWLLGQHPTWRADFVPEQASAMRGYLGVDDRIPRLVEQQHLHNALVLVEDCPEFQCYGSVFWRNSPALDGDIVYAKDIVLQRDAITAAFPGRAVYVARYHTPSLEPIRPLFKPNRPGQSSPTPTPEATPTPALGGATPTP